MEQEKYFFRFSELKEKLLKKPFVKNRIFLILLFAGLVLNLVLLILVYLGIHPEDNIIQTRFNSFYGVTQTGSWKAFYNIYFLGFFVYLVNTALAAYSFEKERIISFFLLVLSIVSQIILIFQVFNFVKLINL